MKIRTRYIKTAVALFTTLFIFTDFASAQPMTIDSILLQVEKNNPEFKIYDARISAYKEYAKGATALDAPQIGGGFFMTPYNVNMWKADEMTGSSGMGSFMLTAQQMIVNSKKLKANANYMNSMSTVDSSMKNVMRNEMFMMVKMNYYEWLIMKKKLIVLTESEKLIDYLVESTELKYTYGMDKLTAYYKAKAMLGEVQIMKLMLEQEIKQKMIQLNTFMARDQNIRFEIDTSYKIQNYESTLADTLSIKVQRSDFTLLTNKINLLESKQRYELSKKYPDFGIRYDHMFPFGASPQQFSLMFMCTIPLAPWSKKMYTANVKGLVLEMESLKYEQQSLVNRVSGNLNNLKVMISTKKKQIELTEKLIVPSMKNNYEAELLAYEQNNEMLFMVLDAWQNLKLANLTRLDQIMELLLLQVQYEKELEVKK